MNPLQPTINTGSLPEMKTFGAAGNGPQIYAMGDTHDFLINLEAVSKDQSAGHSAYHAMTIVKAVNGLRSNTMPANSYINNTNPRRRCVVYSGFEIEYQVDRCGMNSLGVQIIDIRLRREEAKQQERAGLWGVEHDSTTKEWIAERLKHSLVAKNRGNSKENPIKVGINGYCKDLEHAANIMPSHIVKGDEMKLKKLQSDGYDLFYVPVEGNAAKAGWKSMVHMAQVWKKENHIEAAQILASYMLEAHNKGLHVEWTSHRGGSFVLTEAMKLLSQSRDNKGQAIDLNKKQKIFLSDHTTGHAHADQQRRALNMDVSDSKWVNAAPGIGQLIGGTRLGADSVACSINELIKHTPKGQRLNKAIDAYDSVKTVVKSNAATGATIGGLASQFGVTTAFALAVVKAIAATAVASIPGLNEKYHSNSMQPYKNIANKFKKV